MIVLSSKPTYFPMKLQRSGIQDFEEQSQFPQITEGIVRIYFVGKAMK